MQSSQQSTHRLRRLFAIARRPSSLIAIGHSARDQLESMPLDELRLLREAAELALKQERARSAMRHWSYDVNRHIAIKAARDRIAAEIGTRAARPAVKAKKPRTSPRLAIGGLRPN